MTYHPLEASTGFLLGQTYRKMVQLTNLRFKPYDLTTEQWLVMSCLAEQDGISQTELADVSRKDKTTITRILDTLERKGMIRKQRNPGDKRAHDIYLTEQGRERVAILGRIEEQLMQQIFSNETVDVTKFREMLHATQKNIDHALGCLPDTER